ncbi:hypothetical protein [Pseudomonas extremaustralis]
MAINERRNMGVDIHSQLHQIDITVSNKRKVLVISYFSNSHSIYAACQKIAAKSKSLNVEKHFPILDEHVLSGIEEVFNSLNYYGHDFNLGHVEQILMMWFVSNVFIDTSLLGEFEVNVFKQRAIENLKELKENLDLTRKNKSLYAGSPEEKVYIPLEKASFAQLKKEYESRKEFSICQKSKSVKPFKVVASSTNTTNDNVTISNDDFDFDDDVLSKDFNKEEPTAKHLDEDFNFDEFDDEPKTKNASDLIFDDVLTDFEEILETGTERIATEKTDNTSGLTSNDVDFSKYDIYVTPETAKLISEMVNDVEVTNKTVNNLRANIKGSALDNARGIKKKED